MLAGRRWVGVLLACGWAACGATYWVAPSGLDASSGTSREAPLRTIQAGVNRLQPGDTLLVRGGVYRETITFPRSGEPGRPITVEAAPGEQVTVSGCEPVTGWQRGPGRTWIAPMPWTLGLGRNQVFAGGQVQIEARFPNEPAKGLEMYVAGLSPLWPTFGEFSLPTATKKEQPGRIVSPLLDGQPDNWWQGALYYGVHYEGWCGQTGVVESSKSGEITVGDRTRGWWFGSAYGGGDPANEEGRGMLVGHLHALDQPGEWVWLNQQLHLIPTGDGPPRDIEAKRRQLAFDLSGREQLTIRRIDVQAASVRMADTAWCRFEQCRLSYISHFLRQYDMGQVEHDHDTILSGETGIYVSGHDNTFLSCAVRVSAGAGFHLRGYHHTIHNCLIDEVSYTAHYLNAITDAVSDFPAYENFLVGGHVITYNTMRNAGRHFFNFYGNGPSTQSRTRSGMDYLATLFAHNHLYNGMLQTRDAGFITGYYCSAGTLDGLNSQVVYNVLHDDYDLAAMKWNVLGPIYLDAGTCNVDVRNNLLWAAPGALQRSIWFNTCCTDCTERDNVFLPQFTRTSAELTARDFPLEQPFRFGHDFDQPPPLPAWPPLDRRAVDLQRIVAHAPEVTVDAGGLHGLRDGSWFNVDGLDLSDGWQSLVMKFATAAVNLNTDHGNRRSPRHHQATDPLVLEMVTNDGVSPGVGHQWTFLNRVKDGAWVRFGQVPLGDGYQRFRLVYGRTSDPPATAEVRLDRLDGPLVATLPLPRTDRDRGGSVQIYGQAVAPLAPEAKGLHDVFVVFHATGPKLVGEFEYARFERYRGEIALAKTEVRLEVRAGRRDGELLGVIYPRPTGGAATFRELVAPLEPGRGAGPVCFVVRSALGPAPLGTVAGLRFERAQAPLLPAGVGAPPRRTADGRWVFPPPTNRPVHRPADKYAGGAGDGQPRLVTVIPRLATPPVLDGRMPTTPGLKLTLAESWDRSLAQRTSEAWLAYDDQALYLALRHPVTTTAGLRAGHQQWGADDGMEVAIQDGLRPEPGPILNLYGYPDGTLQGATASGAPDEVIEKLRAATTYRAVIGDREWTCTWRLPFSVLGVAPRTAPMLNFNLGVYRAGDKSWTVWRGTGGANWRVSSAGVLAFADEAGTDVAVPRDHLALWLDAADPRSVERAADGGVATWRDKSGRARDAAQPEAARRPQYAADALLGRPALKFSETTKTWLAVPDLAAQKITATIFAVVSNPEPGSEVNHDPRVLTASDGQGYDYVVGLALSVPGLETGGPRVLSGVYRDKWAKVVHVGCFSPGLQTYLTGLVSEILVYDRALTPDETAQVRAYLACKWRLP